MIPLTSCFNHYQRHEFQCRVTQDVILVIMHTQMARSSQHFTFNTLKNVLKMYPPVHHHLNLSPHILNRQKNDSHSISLDRSSERFGRNYVWRSHNPISGIFFVLFWCLFSLNILWSNPDGPRMELAYVLHVLIVKFY